MGFDLTQLRQDMCIIDPDDSDNYANWGKLVKTWTTGINQFNDNNDYSIPATGETVQPLGAMSKDQFKRMLGDARVTMTIPDSVSKFVFVQDDDSTVIVRIPAKQVLDDVQRLLVQQLREGDGIYPLPPFYQGVWDLPPVGLNQESMLKMHCQRLGEYTINTCG
jgi:hypothetical protein